MNPLPSLIRASSHDAAAMNMRKHGRTKWNQDDWNLMCDTQERLIRSCYGKASDHNQPNWCYIRFGIAEAMEKAGQFTLKSRLPDVLAAIDETLEVV